MLTELQAKLEAQDIQESIKELEQVQVLKLTKQDLDIVDELISTLPEDEAKASLYLCFSMVLVKIQKGDTRGAKEWQNALVSLRGTYTEGSEKRNILENHIFCAGMAISQTPNTNLILNLSILAHEHGEARYPLAKLTATNKTPSVLRGAKDLSFLSKHYKASVSIVKPLLGTLLEDDAKGVCDVGIAEILYELGDINGASLQLAGALGAGNPEIVFAALAIMARIGAVDTTAKKPEEILGHIESNVITEDAAYLRPNFLALKARFDMLVGDRDAVKSWMDNCGINDLDSCIPIQYYQRITKCRGYLALGECRGASTLSESLTLTLQEGYRPMDTIECLVISAIACEALGSTDTAYKKLEKGLEIAHEFGYIRVFSDFGKPLYALLAKYRKAGAAGSELSGRYLDRILESARTYGTLWPRLFTEQQEEAQEAEPNQITQAELDVLTLLESGKVNKEIAADLGISANTVKFHLKNLYEKLCVSNRMELVSEAKKRGYLL